MTSWRQWHANRLNALKSTGPRTEEGKGASRRNAIRHGLDRRDGDRQFGSQRGLSGLRAAIIADYDAETAVERELVLRLASLLWRLRRIIAIETDLLRMEAEILRERSNETAMLSSRAGDRRLSPSEGRCRR
jgi:hypothetical protein